jgi:hypothetical protein
MITTRGKDLGEASLALSEALDDPAVVASMNQTAPDEPTEDILPARYRVTVTVERFDIEDGQGQPWGASSQSVQDGGWMTSRAAVVACIEQTAARAARGADGAWLS